MRQLEIPTDIEGAYTCVDVPRKNINIKQEKKKRMNGEDGTGECARARPTAM